VKARIRSTESGIFRSADVRYLLYSILASSVLGGTLLVTQTKAKSSSLEPAKSVSPESPRGSGQSEKPQEEYEDEMEDFVPSEKVPADSAISFPVDI
jgi:hypothetical protein